jgi:hypothetical protein
MIFEVLKETEDGKVMNGELNIPSLTTIDNSHISIWPFYEAPKLLQDLCSMGGDEEFIIFIPRAFQSNDFAKEPGADFSYPCALEALWRGYTGDPDMYQFENGLVICWDH